MRPFSAMLFTCSPVITRLTSPDCVSTWLVIAAIEMVSVTAPTSSWKSAARRDAASSTTLVRSTGLKPVSSTRSV